MQEIKFDIIDFNGKAGEDYSVFAYTQDPEESDQYTIVISEKYGEDIIEYHADSSGNVFGDEAGVLQDELTMLVHTILFIRREHGIIRGF